MKFFEGMEHVETMKIYYPRCTGVKASKNDKWSKKTQICDLQTMHCIKKLRLVN